MKRAQLVFPPRANPTYTPLGLASLCSYLRREAPGLRFAVRDLNLECWYWLAGQDPQGEAMLHFLRSPDDAFFDQPTYLSQLTVWRRLAGRMAALTVDARRLAVGEEGGALGPWLDQEAQSLVLAGPDLVGISVLFPDQVPFALALARRVRHWGEQSGQPPLVVLGGASTSALDSDELLRIFPCIDGVMLGEGEAGAAALVRGEPLEGVPGLAYRRGGSVIRNRRAAPKLDQLPDPDFTGLPLARYLNPEPVLTLVSSRGCSWHRCRFCSHNASFGAHRVMPAVAFVDQMERLLEQHGVRHFYLTDENMPAPLLRALSEEILRRRLGISFHVMARPTADFTTGTLDLAATAGCVWISWGVESGSQRLLNLSGKGTEVPVIKRVLGAARQAGISNLAMMIFGLPGGDDSDLQLSLAFIEQIYPNLDAMSGSAFVLFEGTPFARRAVSLGLEVTGRGVILTAQGGTLHSRRLSFLERSGDGSLRPPRGPLEVAAWQQRGRWLGELPLLNSLCVEHYLLHASRHSQRSLPGIPFPNAA